MDEGRLCDCERFVMLSWLADVLVRTVRIVVPARPCLVKPSRLKLELLVVVIVRLHDLLEYFGRLFATSRNTLTLIDLVNRLDSAGQ